MQLVGFRLDSTLALFRFELLILFGVFFIFSINCDCDLLSFALKLFNIIELFLISLFLQSTLLKIDSSLILSLIKNLEFLAANFIFLAFF